MPTVLAGRLQRGRLDVAQHVLVVDKDFPAADAVSTDRPAEEPYGLRAEPGLDQVDEDEVRVVPGGVASAGPPGPAKKTPRP